MIWKKYNEIQLTKNKMDLNNRKLQIMGTVTENILRICYTDIYRISIARYIK